MISVSTACRNASTSNCPFGPTNFIRFSDDRLHAESSRNMYSEHGFEALMRDVFLHGCQRLIVVSNCMPGSPHCHVASAISLHQIARPIAVFLLAGMDRLRPEIPIFHHRFHELIRRAHGIIRVLEEDRAVSVAIERGIVTRFDQRVRLLLFLRFAPDKPLDIRVIDIEDHHLGRAPRLAAGFDHARERIEALHEGERSAGPPAAGENRVFFAQRRKVRARARAPLEQHAFGLRQVENRFERILHRNDEAGRALRLRFRFVIFRT